MALILDSLANNDTLRYLTIRDCSVSDEFVNTVLSDAIATNLLVDFMPYALTESDDEDEDEDEGEDEDEDEM